jgi:tetratricopeptide (TPR) repeat protein
MLPTIVLAAVAFAHVPVTTTNQAAQQAFGQGLLFFEAFDGGDAELAFAKAATLDPRFAMAYWGEALADGPDLNTAMMQQSFAQGKAAIDRAVDLESGASPLGRGFIDAMALRYRGSWSDWRHDDAAYRDAMVALAASSGDATAAMLTAEALMEHGRFAWSGDRPQTADTQRALALVQAELAHDPNDLMANHLCIHLYDRAPDRSPARACARRLDSTTFPPQAEHLAHMPAHYWIETGDYADALASSERAYALFMQLEQIPGRNPDHDRYLPHDTYVGFSAAMMLGNDALAQLWSQRTGAAYDTSFDALTALRFGHFNRAYARATGSTPSALAVRGYAALELGHLDEARKLDAQLRKITTLGYLPQLFFARVAESEGHLAQANDWIDRALQEQRSDFWAELIPLVPALEVRANLALRQRDYARAVSAYNAALTAFPSDPRALFGLAAALDALGEQQQAAQVRARFDALWKDADTTLTVSSLL